MRKTSKNKRNDYKKNSTKHLLLINLKTYREGTGSDAKRIAKIAETLQTKNKDVQIMLSVQATDLSVLRNIKIPLLAQHADPITYGGNTGKILPQAIRQAGAIGTILNHSERRLNKKIIKKTIELCKKQNLIVVLCVKNEKEAQEYTKFSPDYIAVEPPELIGGKISISSAKPELITKTLKKTKSIPLLCGAGIHTKEDVSHAVKLGAKGVLVASGVVKAKNKTKEIKDLINGFYLSET